MLKVKLIAYTPEPEKLIASAARLCYSKSSIDEMIDQISSDKVASFVNMLSEIGHESPIEHASFTFAIEGLSRSALAQITRHRIASFSVQSQRYVSEENFAYVIPPEVESIEEAREEYIKSMQEADKHYNILTDILQKHHEKTLIKEGKDPLKAKKLAKKQAIEDARFVLPNACETKMICTMNARSLINFFSHRCCNRAQWEIRELANRMLALVYKVAPNLFKNAGPKCLKDKCPEGKMSCGKASEVEEYFKKLKEEAKK